MGFFSSLRQIKKWFNDKTGISESKSLKRKHDECENINNKKARMDDSLVEVVEISDESLCEAEEVEITEPGPSTMPLRASPPVMLSENRCRTRRFLLSHSAVDLTKNSDDENKMKRTRSLSLSIQPFISNKTFNMVKSASIKSILENKYSSTSSAKGSRISGFNMESQFSSLMIDNIAKNNSEEKALAMILKHYTLPKLESFGVSSSSNRSSVSNQNKNVLNNSNLFSSSGKENVDIPELSIHKNRIIKHEMFYDRIIRKFKEKQAAIELARQKVQQKSPEDIFKEKLEIMKHEFEKIEPPKKKEVFPGYSKEIQEYIVKFMSGPQNEKISSDKNIKKSDLKTVYLPTAWLNDEVINHYLSMIVNRDPLSIHTFDTFFYFKLSSHGYQSVRRWTRKKDIFACNKMFIPIHLGNHWCLTCVNFINKTIKYYDSLGGKNPKCLDIIFNYLKEEYKDKKKEEFDCSGWKLMNESDCPKQLNGYDCGVFTCVNAEYLSRDAILDFTQSDMPKLRLRLCYEIINNKLCY